MSKQRIEDPTIDQVQPGDWVEATAGDHKFAGEVWQSETGALVVGVSTIRWENRVRVFGIEITAITRDVPDLPTKPGTVGRATVRGVQDVRIMLLAGVDEWISAVPVSGWVSHHHEDDIDASTFVLELEGDGE